MPCTCVVLGHSFITGTLHHLSPASRPTSHRLASLLRVSDVVTNLQLIGQRGAQVTKPNFQLPEQALIHYAPTVVILDYGSNDLANGADPLEVATTIIDIANTLINKYSVAHVVICSVLNRTSALGSLTAAQFKSLAYKVNHYLKTMCTDEPNLFYHIHKGFWSIPIHQWSHDGIHPNTKIGRKKYIASIRKAIFLSVGRLCRYLD